MRGRWVEDRIEERICKIRVIDGVIANYYPQEELIRCKDCVFNHGGECWGFGDGHLVCDDDYCSGGERKEE